jgi:hypothetical protein
MKLGKVKAIARTILRTVQAAEALFSEIPKSGPDKKAWVVETLNDKINIPFIGEKTEAKIFGVIVDIVVEVWSDLKD